MLGTRTLALSLLAVGTAATLSAQTTTFTIRVENISKGEVLKLSNGKTAPFVLAPVLWAVHAGAKNPLFTGGQPDMGKGLETLAETGNPGPLARAIPAQAGVIAVGADDHPVAATEGGPITPGHAYEFTISAEPGQFLSVAAMFGQSNDWFYANERPIALFNGTKAVAADMTAQLALWDAGTEVDEEPGLGPNQGPRQKDPSAGTPEREPVAHARSKWSVPGTSSVLRLSITPKPESMSSK